MQINIEVDRLRNGLNKLLRKWEEEPVQMIVVTGFAVTATAKLIDSVSAAQGRRAYARQVNHKIKTQGVMQ